MTMYSDNQRLCGCCALWGGRREPSGRIFPAPYANVDSDERGICMGGGFSGTQMKASGGCDRWQLWPGLRKMP